MGAKKSRIFKDRAEAGKILAKELKERNIRNPAIFALPRGGVPIAYEVAKMLNASLDTVISRKLGVPGNQEFGFGALAPGDIVILNNDLIQTLGLSQEQIDQVLAEEREELERRSSLYKSGEFIQEEEYKSIILVDDGLATGITALAAIESVRLIEKAREIYFATPVSSEEAVKMIEGKVKDVITLSIPEYFLTVGQWFERFNQVSDDEVIYMLHSIHDVRTGRK